MSRAVRARAASASRSSSARCEGESLTAAWAGLPLAEAWAGAAEAAPVWTAAASRAVTPAMARVWEVRLREELLLNTDSFCVAADRATRGDPDGGSTARA